ncbi:MAG: OsmC family protein [Bacilli bacterium]|jgi:ribosomal protein S12 methylthiotransferase accessory factor
MSQEMIITFPGGKRVDASYAGFEFKTDQPADHGGEGSAPSPFHCFLASLGTCAGFYALSFCAQRGIPTEGIRLVQRIEPRPEGGLGRVVLEIQVPPSFPEKYLKAIAHAASACAVKKAIENPPAFEVTTVVAP